MENSMEAPQNTKNRIDISTNSIARDIPKGI
jgi:hypothetical protein